MTYKNCKKIILSVIYNYSDMCNKLDTFLLCERITKEQYTELMEIINSNNK